MSNIKFMLPTFLMLPKKRVKDKRFSVDLNTFRAAHHRTYTEAKKYYKEALYPQLEGVEPIKGEVKIHYTFYAARNNSPDLDNFVGAAKKFFQDALVQAGIIEDDNVNFIVANSEEYGGIDRANPRIEAAIYKIK